MKCSLPYKEAANNSKSFLVDTGALEDMQSNRIKDIAIFRRVNRQLSKNAKDVYGVEGKLWLEDDGEEIALPNRPVLNAIDDKRKELGLYEDRIAGSIKKTTPKPIEKQVEKPIIQDTKGFKEEIENKGIKPGVSELFESNPELANEVYEALGFKQIESVTANNVSKVLSNSFSKQDLQLRVDKTNNNDIETTILRDDKMVGFITLTVKNGKVHVKITEVFEEFQKQGIAENVYIEINRILQENSMGELRSDVEFLKDTKTEEWTLDGKILSKEEKKKITDDVDLFIELEEDGRLGKTEAVRPAIKLWEKLVRKGLAEKTEDGYKFKNQITPQQKQRAQQAYSQYLNTVFPDSKVEEIDNSLYISVLEDLKSNKIIEKQCS